MGQKEIHLEMAVLIFKFIGDLTDFAFLQTI
jgi:hypothetical protein